MHLTKGRETFVEVWWRRRKHRSTFSPSFRGATRSGNRRSAKPRMILKRTSISQETENSESTSARFERNERNVRDR